MRVRRWKQTKKIMEVSLICASPKRTLTEENDSVSPQIIQNEPWKTGNTTHWTCSITEILYSHLTFSHKQQPSLLKILK